MNVLEVIPALRIGGAEVLLKDMILQMKRQNHSLYLIVFAKLNNNLEEELESEGVSIYFLTKKKGFDFSLIFKLRSLIKKLSPDVIHTHLTSLEYVFYATFWMNTKIYHTVHNLAEYEILKNRVLIRKNIIKSKRVVMVSISEMVKKSLYNFYTINYDIPLIHNGILSSSIKEKLVYFSDDCIRIINVGRLVKQKNHEALIRIAKKLVEKKINFVLDIYGDGELKEYIEQLIFDNDLSGIVNIKGEYKDVRAILCDYDIFVLPSLWEGMSITLIEAMMANLFIIATNVGGNSEMLSDNCGVIVECEEEFVDKIVAFSEMAICERKKICQNAKNKASMLYNVQKMCDDYINLFEKGIKIDGSFKE